MRWRKLHASVIFLVAVAGSGCRKSVPEGISVHESFTPLVRPGTTVAAGIDLEKLKNAPLYQKHKEQLQVPILDQFVQRFGVDPRRDLKQLLYVSDGKKSYFLAQGVFESDAIKQKIRTLGLQPSTDNGTEVFGDGRNALALLTGPVALMGDADSVHEVIATKDKGQGAIPEKIEERLRAMPKNDEIWIVSSEGLPFLSLATRTDVESALSNIVGFVAGGSASLGLDTELRLQATLSCFSMEGATRVHDALRAAVAFGRLSTKDSEASLLKIYDSIQIARTDKTVDVNAHLTEAQMEELLSRLVQR